MKIVNLLDICNPKQWKTVSQTDLSEKGYPCYSANGKIGFYKEYNHEFPTLLIGCRGTCGSLHITEPFSYTSANAMALDNLNTNLVDIKFLFYFFRKRGFKDIITGSSQPQITRQGLQKIQIPLPPFEDQKRIVKILDEADALRQKRKQAIGLLDDYLKSVFLEMFGDPVKNPKGWEAGTIANLVSEVKYGTSAVASSIGEFPYLRMNNITYSGELDISNLKYINLKDNEKEKYLTKRGDLLFNRTNSKELVGKTTVYNLDKSMAIAGYLIRVRTNEKAIPEYISGYLNSKHGKKTLESMCKSIIGMANINAKELQKIKILVPPIGLQIQYKNILQKTFNFKQIMLAQSAELEIHFQALMQKAFKSSIVTL